MASIAGARRRSRRWMGVLAVTVIAAAGCGSDDESSGGPTSTQGSGPATSAAGVKLPLERTKVTIAASAQNTALISTYVADRQGFFAAEGLEVTVTPFAGAPAALTGVVTDAAQVYVGGFPTLISLYGSPQQPVIFHESMSTPGFVFYSQKDVKSWKDLADRGGTLGVSSIGGMDHRLGQYLAREAGVDPDKIKFQAGGISSQRVAGLRANSLTAISAIPADPRLVAEGFTELARLDATIERFPLEVYAATKDFYEKNPGVIQALVRADLAAAAWIAENEDKAFDHLRAQLNFPASELEYNRSTMPEYLAGLAFEGYSVEGLELVAQFSIDAAEPPALVGKTASEIVKAFVPDLS